MTYKLVHSPTCDKTWDRYAFLTITSAMALAFSPRSRCFA